MERTGNDYFGKRREALKFHIEGVMADDCLTKKEKRIISKDLIEVIALSQGRNAKEAVLLLIHILNKISMDVILDKDEILSYND